MRPFLADEEKTEIMIGLAYDRRQQVPRVEAGRALQAVPRLR